MNLDKGPHYSQSLFFFNFWSGIDFSQISSVLYSGLIDLHYLHPVFYILNELLIDLQIFSSGIL